MAQMVIFFWEDTSAEHHRYHFFKKCSHKICIFLFLPKVYFSKLLLFVKMLPFHVKLQGIKHLHGHRAKRSAPSHLNFKSLPGICRPSWVLGLSFNFYPPIDLVWWIMSVYECMLPRMMLELVLYISNIPRQIHFRKDGPKTVISAK